MTVEQSFKLGAILKKLNLNLEELKNYDFTAEDGKEKLGFFITKMIIDRYADLEKELVAFIASYRKISEDDVRNADFSIVIETFGKIFNELVGGLSNRFLSSSPSTSGNTET